MSIDSSTLCQCTARHRNRYILISSRLGSSGSVLTRLCYFFCELASAEASYHHWYTLLLAGTPADGSQETREVVFIGTIIQACHVLGNSNFQDIYLVLALWMREISDPAIPSSIGKWNTWPLAPGMCLFEPIRTRALSRPILDQPALPPPVIRVAVHLNSSLLQSQAHLHFVPIRFEPGLDRYMHSYVLSFTYIRTLRYAETRLSLSLKRRILPWALTNCASDQRTGKSVH